MVLAALRTDMLWCSPEYQQQNTISIQYSARSFNLYLKKSNLKSQKIFIWHGAFLLRLLKYYKNGLWLLSSRCLSTKGHAGTLSILSILIGTYSSTGLEFETKPKSVCVTVVWFQTPCYIIFYLLSNIYQN